MGAAKLATLREGSTASTEKAEVASSSASHATTSPPTSAWSGASSWRRRRQHLEQIAEEEPDALLADTWPLRDDIWLIADGLQSRVTAALALRATACIALVSAFAFSYPWLRVVGLKVLSTVAAFAGPAAFWPTDGALNAGWGRRFNLAVAGSSVVGVAALLAATWPLSQKYPLPGQSLLHRSVISMIMLWFLNALVGAVNGTVTWAQHRIGLAFTGSSTCLALLGLHILEHGLDLH